MFIYAKEIHFEIKTSLFTIRPFKQKKTNFLIKSLTAAYTLNLNYIKKGPSIEGPFTAILQTAHIVIRNYIRIGILYMH